MSKLGFAFTDPERIEEVYSMFEKKATGPLKVWGRLVYYMYCLLELGLRGTLCIMLYSYIIVDRASESCNSYDYTDLHPYVRNLTLASDSHNYVLFKVFLKQ